MHKYEEVDMKNFEDIKKLSEAVNRLTKNGYEIVLVQKIGDTDSYGIHFESK